MSKKNLVFKKTLVARALMVAFGVGMATVGFVPEVMAQSNAVGTVYGKVNVGIATSVVIKNTDTNLTKTATIDSTGKFQVTALPAGHYKISLQKDSNTLSTIELDVLGGQGTEADFGAAGGSSVQAVEVSARRTRIDVSNATNGATFTAKELAKIPVAQSLGGIIQLAPNTTKADSRYAGGASFGGGGASENSYYINGFPVVNPLTQLGSSELPFGAIQQAQILTGGFGAEFGRSVGGVVNVITKSGTNNWEMGGMVSITPDALRSTPLDIYYPTTGRTENVKTDGLLYLPRSKNSVTEKKVGAYIGGPIIEDKLFMFLAVEDTKTNSSFYNSSVKAQYNTDPLLNPNLQKKDANGRPLYQSSVNGYTNQYDEVQRYLGKFDWQITDDHRLELTLIGDTPKSDVYLSGFDSYLQPTGVRVSGGHYQNVDNVTPSTGSNIQMLKYIGNLTSDLTLTALVGQSKTQHKNYWDGYNPAQDLYQVSAPVSAQVPGLFYNTGAQVLSGNILPVGAEDQVKSYRLDLEYKIGKHTIRGGIDSNKDTSLNAGDMSAGGGVWTYYKTGTPNTPMTLTGQQGVIVANGGGFGTQGYYVRKQIFNDATSAYSNQTAQYIEDRYQVTKDILLIAGLRNEGYTNKNGDGVPFLEINRQIQPRLAATWDVNGDSSTKVFGSLGRYSVPIPTHLAVRGASRSTFTRQYFTYTGVDPVTGAPTGLNALTGVLSSNNELGQAKLAQTVAALDMKPNMQDEITLGFEKAYSPNLNFGAKATYRRLVSTIDDFCDQRPFDKWAADPKHKVDTSNWGGFSCASFNPGEANSFLVDFAGTGKNLTRVDLSAADLGFEKAQRTYTALDLFVEHPYRNGWYGKLNYTWSRSTGNTEGQTLSDVAQTDVSATQTWDHYELMQYANGLLPNNRTHQIKAFGFYDLTKEITVGGNLLLAAGRPKNCLGTYPDALVTPGFPDYGSSYHYCNGAPSPRGSIGTLPWDFKLDMNIAYKPEALKGVTFKVDVFNLLNRQTVQTIDETYNLDGATVSPTYNRVISYTAPRSVRLTLEYNKKF